MRVKRAWIAAAGLDRRPCLADAVAERGDGGVEVESDEGKAPEEGGPVGPSPTLDRLGRLLHHLEDD